MIKKSVFEDDLISGMLRELRPHDQKLGFDNLDKAADYLNSAAQILEEAGMTSKADAILNILIKIANTNSLGKPVSDRHTNGLTPDKMVKNLEDHGSMFNLSDDGNIGGMIEETLGDKDYFNKLINEEKHKQDNKQEIDELLKDKSINALIRRRQSDNLSKLRGKDDFSDADDLLNIDIGDEALEVNEDDLDKPFEDSD